MPQMSQVLRESAIGMLTAGMSTRAVARELNVRFSTICHLQRRFREIGSTFNRPHNRRPHVTTTAQDLHIQHLHLQDRLRPATWTAAAANEEFLHKLSETVSGKLICMIVILIRVSTWLQFVVVTDLSGQMLTFDGVLHFGEVFSSRMNPGFRWTGQMADRMCGVVWVSGLLMSTLWIEWPMVAVGLWYGQAYVMDNEHRCILLMPFWIHKDTVMRSCGPLLCYSSTTITSCCSMIMPHVARICTQFLKAKKHPSSCMASILTAAGQVTHWACLGCSGSVYTTACSTSCQYSATSYSHWRGVDWHSTGHNQQPDQLYVKEKCCTVWGKWWSHHILTGFWTPPIQ